jgi:hypothetical protein
LAFPVSHGEILVVLGKITGDENALVVYHDDIHTSDVACPFFDDFNCFHQGFVGVAFVEAPDVIENFFCADAAFLPDF